MEHGLSYFTGINSSFTVVTVSYVCMMYILNIDAKCTCEGDGEMARWRDGRWEMGDFISTATTHDTKIPGTYKSESIPASHLAIRNPQQCE